MLAPLAGPQRRDTAMPYVLTTRAADHKKRLDEMTDEAGPTGFQPDGRLAAQQLRRRTLREIEMEEAWHPIESPGTPTLAAFLGGAMAWGGGASVLGWDSVIAATIGLSFLIAIFGYYILRAIAAHAADIRRAIGRLAADALPPIDRNSEPPAGADATPRW